MHKNFLYKMANFFKILSPQMFSEIKVTLEAKPTERNEIGPISKSFQSIRLK